MQKKLNLLIFCCGFLILGFTSCQKDGSKGTNFVFDIEDEFELSLSEKLTIGENTSLLMDISSLREFDCENYSLLSNSSVFVGKIIEVSVSELMTPDNCVPGLAPAMGQVTFNALVLGNYDLTVSLVNQIENRGTLSVYPNYYEIQLEEENGILLPYTKLHKIPQQTIWGYVGYEDNDINVASELLNDMYQSLETVSNISNGNYGHFQFNDGQVELPKEKISATRHLTFIYHLTTPIEELKIKVEEVYCPQYQSQIDLKIYTSDGVVIDCL